MVQLLKVQEQAILKSRNHARYGLFMEMGLGKTLTVLHEFAMFYNMKKVDVMVVFCPNSLVRTWKNEVEKHGYDFPVKVKPGKGDRVEAGDLVIYNYESIIATPGEKIPLLLSQHRCYCVFDESVQIKNFKSARWKKIRGWMDQMHMVRLLSGRPMVQNAMDLWSQLKILGGKVNNSPYAYRNKFCRMGGWMGKVIVGINNEDELRDIMREVSWTATKKEWTNLPEKLYTTREYEMTAEQKRVYKQMFKDMVVEIKDKMITVDQAVHKYSKLQQVTSGFMIDEDGNATPIMDFDKVPKVKLLDEILEEVSGKVIIFAHYRATVEALAARYGCAVIRGGMTEDEIGAAMDRFNNSMEQVMVCQSTAAKYGLTLLGNDQMGCNTTVYFENNYSLDARIQSEDRNHRHGQKNPVLYIDLVGTPVESRIIRALQAKDGLSKAVQEIST